MVPPHEGAHGHLYIQCKYFQFNLACLKCIDSYLLIQVFIFQEEIVQATDEAGRAYYNDTSEEDQTVEGLEEFVTEAVTKKRSEMETYFNKAQSVANSNLGPEFLEQVSIFSP